MAGVALALTMSWPALLRATVLPDSQGAGAAPVTGASGPPAGSGTAQASSGLEELRRTRQEARHLLALARRDEAAAVAAVLAAEARVEKARRLLEERRREAAAAARRAREAERLVSAMEAEAARRRHVVDRWVRFLYEEGPVAYLDVLLGATDFHDFTTRLEVLRQVVGQAVGELRELKDVHRRLVARRLEAGILAGSLEQAQRRAAAALAEAEAARRAREEALRQARSLLGERAAAMDRLDGRWREALPVLDRFLARLPTLAWDRVPPDAVEPDDGAGTVRVVIREETVDAWLVKPDPELAALRVRFEAGGVVVTSRPPSPSLFRLSGRLRVEGGQVRFEVEALDFLDVPVGAGVLAALNAQRGLRLSLAGLTDPLRVAGVEVGDGFLALRLAR